MNFKKIEILGLRGFFEKQELTLGIPNGIVGSGFTVIVGPNNSGKSTIYEAFRAISQSSPPSITEGRRNKIAGDRIDITIINDIGNKLHLRTTSTGGSETEFHQDGITKHEVKFFTLPSRRTFQPFFHKGEYDREQYINSSSLNAVRGTNLDIFHNRLFKIQKNQAAFNAILSKVLGHIPNWHLEQNDNGQYYLKFNYNGTFHNSDGSGEGLLSVFTIVDTLYDSKVNDLIFIDEPELSLHPSLQKKLLNLLLEYSATRQIIVSTHSPYFISWKALENGGQIVRTTKEISGTKIHQLQETTAKNITPLINNLNNPHILGLDAREIFFLDDNIILVEGQEDVIFLNRILELKGQTLKGTFYGWGVGGSSNTDKVIDMLKDLGFKKIAVVLDNNMRHLISILEKKYSEYKFIAIPTDDIRGKQEVKARTPIEGLIDSAGKNINPNYDKKIDEIITLINNYLN